MASPDQTVQEILEREAIAATDPYKVYDGAAPKGVAYPFTTIGDDLIDDDGTKDTLGWSFTAELQVWDDERTYSRIKGMAEAIRQRLHDQQFEQDGYRLYLVSNVARDWFIEEGGEGRRGVLEYDIRVEPA